MRIVTHNEQAEALTNACSTKTPRCVGALCADADASYEKSLLARAILKLVGADLGFPLALDLGLMFPFSGARTNIENDQRREKAGRTNTVHDDSDRRQESVEDVPVCGGKRGGRRCGVRAR